MASHTYSYLYSVLEEEARVLKPRQLVSRSNNAMEWSNHSRPGTTKRYLSEEGLKRLTLQTGLGRDAKGQTQTKIGGQRKRNEAEEKGPGRSLLAQMQEGGEAEGGGGGGVLVFGGAGRGDWACDYRSGKRRERMGRLGKVVRLFAIGCVGKGQGGGRGEEWEGEEAGRMK